MYIIAKHFSTGGCQTLPVIFKTEKEGKEYLQQLCEKEKKGGYTESFVNRWGDSVVVKKAGENCWQKEYILQKLTYTTTVYAEAVPVRNYCGRRA